MKNIKSLNDIDKLNGTLIPDSVVDHIKRYFKWMIGLFGNNYNPAAVGWIILIEEGDPLTDITFLEEGLGIRGGRNLVTLVKEFVDFRPDTNIFEVFALFNDEFGMIFLIPNENWIGQDLLHHLKTFRN